MTKKSGVFEKLEAEIVRDAGDYVKDRVKRKAIKVGEISILIIIGFILISFGLSFLLGNFFPILASGYNFLIVGVIMLVLSSLIKV